MKNKKILSVAIATTLGVISLVGVTTATNSPEVLDNWDLKICSTTDSSECITIQWKNVWAATTWAWPSAPTTSYWNYYQRWNNYWFSSNPEASISTGDQQIDCSIYNPLKSFSSSTFIISPNWSFLDYCISRNDNLWWWGNDIFDDDEWKPTNSYPVENGSERKWPCDAWYHVPSQWEWYALMDMWAGSSVNWYIEDNISQFYTDFQIPFAGHRNMKHGSVLVQGSWAFLWSSSPDGQARARYFFIDEYAAGADDDTRAEGFSVRCFKDSYLSFPASASTHVTLTLTAWSNTCTLNDYNLWTHDASADNQYVESSWQDIVCEFLQNTWVIVLLSMGNLTDWTKVIWAENFTWVVTAIGNSLWSISNLIWWNYNLSWSQEIYWKAENTLWKWTWDLQIIWTIPAWTPSGTYTWSLEIVIQEGIWEK